MGTDNSAPAVQRRKSYRQLTKSRPPSGCAFSFLEILLAATFGSVIPGFCLGAGIGSMLGACAGVLIWIIGVWPDRVRGITRLPKKDHDVRNYGRWAAELDRWYSRIWLMGTLVLSPGSIVIVNLMIEDSEMLMRLGLSLIGIILAGIAAAVLALPLSVMQHRSLQRRYEARFHQHRDRTNDSQLP